jgi:hypothetical protein
MAVPYSPEDTDPARQYILTQYNSWGRRRGEFHINGTLGVDSSTVTSLPPLDQNIRSIKIAGLPKLTELPAFSTFPQLRSLEFRNLASITSIPPLPEGLLTLSIAACPLLAELPSFPSTLKSLELRKCPIVTTITAFPPDLDTLNLQDMPIPVLPAFSESLKNITIFDVPITVLPKMPNGLGSIKVETPTLTTITPPCPATLATIKMGFTFADSPNIIPPAESVHETLGHYLGRVQPPVQAPVQAAPVVGRKPAYRAEQNEEPRLQAELFKTLKEIDDNECLIDGRNVSLETVGDFLKKVHVRLIENIKAGGLPEALYLNEYDQAEEHLEPGHGYTFEIALALTHEHIARETRKALLGGLLQMEDIRPECNAAEREALRLNWIKLETLHNELEAIAMREAQLKKNTGKKATDQAIRDVVETKMGVDATPGTGPADLIRQFVGVQPRKGTGRRRTKRHRSTYRRKMKRRVTYRK